MCTRRLLSVLSACLAVHVGAGAQAPPARTTATLYEGARLISGLPGASVIDRGAFVVVDGRLQSVGRVGAVAAPPGAVRVDLSGKTVMPAMVNVHVHIGYEGYGTWHAHNHTPANVVDHLQRSAFYGTAATTSAGSSPTDQMLAIQRDQREGRVAPAARLLFMPGMAPPNGGPDHILLEATSELKVVNEVTTAAEARAAVGRLAAQGLRHLKMWVDDRNGTYPKLSPEAYTAIVDEAHRHGMLVHAHAIQLADQKAVLRAGADVLVHMVQRQPLDDEFLALVRQRKPYWATVIGLGDPTALCTPDVFFEQAMPEAVIARIRGAKERVPLQPSCVPASEPTASQRERQMAVNFPQMLAAGARVVLATDTGIHPGHTFGSGEHIELARWVQLGLSPAEAIVAATSRPAELMGQTDLGALEAGRRASFVVLDANPLDDIRHSRRIAEVYLDGVRLDREALRAGFKRAQR